MAAPKPSHGVSVRPKGDLMRDAPLTGQNATLLFHDRTPNAIICQREKGLSGSENGRSVNLRTALMFPKCFLSFEDPPRNGLDD